MQKLNNGNFEYYREDRNQFEYFYNLVKNYKIGHWWWFGDFNANNTYYSIFMCGYYIFQTPHILIVEKDIKSIINFDIINSIPLDNINLFDIIKEDFYSFIKEIKHPSFPKKIDLRRKIYKNINYNFLSLLKWWYEINPNYPKYRKIWRKYKNKNLNYNSIKKEIYYHWQYYISFYHSKNEFEVIKNENKWLSNFSSPNYVEHIYDNEEKTGYWNWRDCGENNI